MMTTYPITAKNWDKRPSANTKGKNAAIVVSTPNITGVETSQVPSTAAFNGSFPKRS